MNWYDLIRENKVLSPFNFLFPQKVADGSTFTPQLVSPQKTPVFIGNRTTINGRGELK